MTEDEAAVVISNFMDELEELQKKYGQQYNLYISSSDCFITVHIMKEKEHYYMRYPTDIISPSFTSNSTSVQYVEKGNNGNR